MFKTLCSRSAAASAAAGLAVVLLAAAPAAAALVVTGPIDPSAYADVVPQATDLVDATVWTGQGSPLGGWDPYGTADTTHSWLDIADGGHADFAAAGVLSLIWGSPNAGNIVTLYDGGSVVGGYTTADLGPVSNTTGPGYLVTITGAFDRVVLSENGFGHFEVGVPSAVVPELSTWAMMLAGFLGLGVAGYRRRRPATVLSL